MKTAQAFHIYFSPGLEQGILPKVLADVGLEGLPLDDPSSIVEPALILLAPAKPSLQPASAVGA